MKRQQIGEIRNIIDFELNIAELKRKNEEKMRIQKEKEMEYKEMKEKQLKEKETKQKL